MDKVRITVLENPFDISKRKDYFVDYALAKPVMEYISDIGIIAKRDIELVYSLNGRIIENEEVSHICPNENDHIVVSSKVKGDDIAKTILLIAVVIASIAVPQLIGIESVFWSAMLSAGIAITGSLLVNAFFPIQPPSLPTLSSVSSLTQAGPASMEQADTYGWGEMRNMTVQGAPIPKIYGVRRVAGTIINRYVTIEDNDQYYNCLMALHDGQIQGVKSIQIDGQDISNFSGIWQRITLGTREQVPIEYFTDTYSNQSYSVEITDSGYVEKTTVGNAAQGLRVEISCPYGLYYQNTQGGLDATYVEISLEYRKVGDSTWLSHQAGGSWSGQTSSGNVTYDSGYSYTSQGFKWIDDCDEVSFTFGSSNLSPRNNTVQFRTGTGYVTFADGWVDFGTYTGVQTVTITGLGKQPTEIRVKQGVDSVLTHPDYWFTNITRTVYAGGTTPGGPTGGNINIIGAQNTPLRRIYEIRNLAVGQYELRLKKIGEGGTTTRYMTNIFLTGVSEIIPDDFAYPYIALLGIRALATSQLSGSVPNITCEVVRSHTIVYDTDLLQWVAKSADNPAWAAYDVLVRPVYTLDLDSDGGIESFSFKSYKGINPYTNIDYDAFSTWADWCDELTPEGNKRSGINIVFDSQMPIWDCLMQIAQVGRGIPIMKGTKFSCVVDKTNNPVQLFTVGNIYEDSFKESFLSIEDRANIIEVTYFDETRDYQRETIQVYGNDWVEGSEEKRSTITLYGCTTYDQAYREAVYRLNCNKYLIRTIEFDVGVDAIACQVGDVIRIQHDITQWGYGGRVLNSTANRVQIDREITIVSGNNYNVYVRHSSDDSVENKAVINSSGVTDVLYVSSSWNSNPAKYDVYTFGQQASEYKLFKVISVSRSQDFKRTITAIEYNASMYTEGAPTTWNPSALLAIPIATSIVLKEGLRADVTGTWVSEVHMSWRFYDPNQQRLSRWEIYRKDTTISDSIWEKIGVTRGLSFVSNSVIWQYLHTYQIAICGYDILADRGHSPNSSNVLKQNITIQWKYAPPENVTNFTATQDGLELVFSWNHVSDPDRRGYEIRQGLSWEGGIVLVKEISENSYTHKLTYDGTYKYHIKAIDTSGNYSSNATTITKTISGIASLINIVYTKEEISDFVNGVANTSNVTSNLIYVHSGNTRGLHVPHSLTDSGVSTWIDSGTSLTPYSGTTDIDGHYISPARDIGSSAKSTLRLLKVVDAENLYVTDLTYPSRTDRTYSMDTDTSITSNTTIRTLYRLSQTSPLTSISWSTYSTPILADFRFFQRKESFILDSIHTALSYTTIYTTVDVPDKTWTFNSKTIGATGTTFDLKGDLGVTIFVNYMAACSVVSNPYYYSIKNKSGTSFYVTLFDDAGAKQSGQVDILIKGY